MGVLHRVNRLTSSVSLADTTGFLEASIEALRALAADPAAIGGIDDIGSCIADALAAGGKLLLAGNGGSAADAQHIAAEFVVRLVEDRDPLPAIALTTDTSVLTAAGNDYGFDQVFARQVRALGRAGDVFLGISTSGNSPNILAALQAARTSGLVTIGLTGEGGGRMAAFCDHLLRAPSSSTAIVQQIHITVGHILCGQAERKLAERS